MAHGPKQVHMDDTGRIIEVVMDEAITDPTHELAVQALPVERKEHGDRGAVDEVLSADHPDAVQALEPVRHAGTRRLPAELAEEAEKRRAAANDKHEGTAHPETEESVEPVADEKHEDDEEK